ncbi:MAG: hypothetical protein ACRCXZ_00890 [Patescibacteria group bacterium]
MIADRLSKQELIQLLEVLDMDTRSAEYEAGTIGATTRDWEIEARLNAQFPFRCASKTSRMTVKDYAEDRIKSLDIPIGIEFAKQLDDLATSYYAVNLSSKKNEKWYIHFYNNSGSEAILEWCGDKQKNQFRFTTNQNKKIYDCWQSAIEDAKQLLSLPIPS